MSLKCGEISYWWVCQQKNLEDLKMLWNTVAYFLMDHSSDITWHSCKDDVLVWMHVANIVIFKFSFSTRRPYKMWHKYETATLPPYLTLPGTCVVDLDACSK